jgi:hypothetical protein
MEAYTSSAFVTGDEARRKRGRGGGGVKPIKRVRVCVCVCACGYNAVLVEEWVRARASWGHTSAQGNHHMLHHEITSHFTIAYKQEGGT